MKNFIVPVDFSKDSIKGLEMAILFSKKMYVNIQMVYVQKASDDYRPGSFEEEHKFAENNLIRIMKEYEPRLMNDSKLRYIIKKGKIYREIVNQVESYNDGVISASTHGASGFEDIFIGSNAFKIISSTSKPVFTLNKGHAPKDIKKIVVPLRLHVDTRQKVPWAGNIAELFGAEIHLITLSTTQNKKDNARLNAYHAQSADYLKKRKIKYVSKKLNGDNLSTMVITYANAINADLVVIMTNKSSGWNLITGSYVQDILNKCPAPVLSITAKEKHIPLGFVSTGDYRD
jgi:nucleotide-binding universal stress UspA family protein